MIRDKIDIIKRKLSVNEFTKLDVHFLCCILIVDSSVKYTIYAELMVKKEIAINTKTCYLGIFISLETMQKGLVERFYTIIFIVQYNYNYTRRMIMQFVLYPI